MGHQKTKIFWTTSCFWISETLQNWLKIRSSMLRESSGSSNVGGIKMGLVPAGNCNNAAENKFFFHQKELHMVKVISKLATHV